MHIPVLLKETMGYLDPQENGNYIDCTLNGGGHTREILKRNGPAGKVLGIELDKDIFEKIRNENIERLIPVNDSYLNIGKIAAESGFEGIKGILFDIGMSSWHVDESQRGFSFKNDEPLLMNYGDEEITAADIVNNFDEKEIERILDEYGEEKYSRKIARKIVEARRSEKIKSTFQLIEIIRESTPNDYHHGKIHFATRTFQALRIAVNRELENFRGALPEALSLLDKDGRLVAISFHSLEDKIIKDFLKDREQKGEIEILTKKPVGPGEEEIIRNPRSRSAKLRAAIKL
jgi:16S rRNA (cytosine1402-N4)-methyltransferase